MLEVISWRRREVKAVPVDWWRMTGNRQARCSRTGGGCETGRSATGAHADVGLGSVLQTQLGGSGGGVRAAGTQALWVRVCGAGTARTTGRRAYGRAGELTNEHTGSHVSGELANVQAAVGRAAS